jgi:SNF family Na+-dependent transporter
MSLFAIIIPYGGMHNSTLFLMSNLLQVSMVMKSRSIYNNTAIKGMKLYSKISIAKLIDTKPKHIRALGKSLK